MSILEQVYAEGGDVILHTIELHSDSWSDRIALVRDYVDCTAVTEDSRTVTFTASGMGVALPKRDASGAQSLKFAIDGVRTEATRLLRQADAEGREINLTYRAYLASDLSEPADSPVEFIVRSFVAQADHVEVTASLFDMIDMRWPRIVYDSSTAPGLKFTQ